MQIQEMQIEVSQFLESLNVDMRVIIVNNCRDDIAKAIGLYIDGTIPVVNLKVNVAFGNVSVNTDYLNRTLTYDEQRFILAHETSHIYLNHVVPRAIDGFTEELIRRNCKSDVHAFLKGVQVFLYLLNIPPPLSVIAKEQEIAADVRAISLTGNENAAINCLTKLVEGNLNDYSHTWETLGVKMPVMTMRERIQEIQRRVSSLCQYVSKPSSCLKSPEISQGKPSDADFTEPQKAIPQKNQIITRLAPRRLIT